MRMPPIRPVSRLALVPASLAFSLAIPLAHAAAQRPNIHYVPPACCRVTAPESFALVHVTDGGRYLILEDGTRWEVSPDDQGTAANWEEESSIVIRVIPAPTGKWEWRLINAEMDQSASARFAGRPMAGGHEQDDQPEQPNS